MKKLSVILATRNEEENIGRCLESVQKMIADPTSPRLRGASEIVVIDEYSTDNTVEIAKKYGAKIFLEPHHENFHITKQIGLEKATGDWILQLDADEVVTPELAKEIVSTVHGSPPNVQNKLFLRHQALIEKRDGPIGKKTGEVVGYFIPRRNIFLGKPLIHAGVYPDGVIRLVKKGKAHFPQKSVHEQISLEGEVSWLSGDLLHYDSPTLKRYLTRLNRYTDLQSQELKELKTPKNFRNFLLFTVYRPLFTFLNLYFRHLGFLDGIRGFLWSLFSSFHFPIAYFKYITFKG
jgi:glycosyltransferase involved in cell wall biosynthesis